MEQIENKMVLDEYWEHEYKDIDEQYELEAEKADMRYEDEVDRRLGLD